MTDGAGSSGVDELDPMEAVERSVDEAFERAPVHPDGTPDGIPGPHGGTPRPMGFVDSEETEPPPTRGDTQ
jgi:hypothetical protein